MGKMQDSVTRFTDIPKIKQAFKHDGLIMFLETAWNITPRGTFPPYGGYLGIEFSTLAIILPFFKLKTTV